MTLFLVLILAVMLGLDLYYAWWADRRLRTLPRSKSWRIAHAIFMAILLATLVTRMLRPSASRTVNSVIPMPIVSAQYLWHLGLLPLVCLAPLLIRAAAWARRTALRKPYTAPTDPGRRAVMRAAAVAVPPLVLGGGVTASLAQLGQFRVREMHLKINDLPPALEGVTIAHLSDFHVGRFMTPAMMRSVIDLTNDLKPDLVLVTGDLIDYALVDLPPAIDELLRLRPACGLAGVALCVGNHDVIEDGPQFIKTVTQSPLPLLVNEFRPVEVRGHPVQLLGIDWARPTPAASAAQNMADSVKAAAAVRDPAAFPILLAHHPHAYEEAARQGLPLTLSGHTHGGQVMATPSFGAGSLFFRYWSGLYEKPRDWAQGNGSQLVVSNGIGNWFPLRINAPAEMIHLTLYRA